MVKRIIALIFIFLCTTVAWAILGSTIFYRTYESKENLTNRVGNTWGTAQVQPAPTAKFFETLKSKKVSLVNGKTVEETVENTVAHSLPLERTRANVNLQLDHRQKGLLWYSTYKVRFEGEFAFRNTSAGEENVLINLPFPAEQALYDDLVITLDGRPVKTTSQKGGTECGGRIAPNALAVVKYSYVSQGLKSWRYDFGSEVQQVRDFELRMTTNFKAIDFPENTLSPGSKRETPDGWELQWSFSNLVTGYDIAMTMPEKLQPGPLAGQISYFAPVSLFFFFFLMFIITTMRGIDLHPMNYFFLAGAFFSFHLLLAYLVDHISIHAAFVICSAVSIFLVVSYLRLVVGLRFAAVEAGISQFIYLVLFSYAFFFKGFTGLAITIGAILTLFVVMQMTGRIRWSEKFAAATSPARVGSV